MLTLPLWIVTEHITPSDPEQATDVETGVPLAFSNSEKLLKFMKANLGGEWKMEMADDRDGLVVLIADLHRLNIEAVLLDPAKDGTGGEQVPLSDLMALADSLRKEAEQQGD